MKLGFGRETTPSKNQLTITHNPQSFHFQASAAFSHPRGAFRGMCKCIGTGTVLKENRWNEENGENVLEYLIALKKLSSLGFRGSEILKISDWSTADIPSWNKKIIFCTNGLISLVSHSAQSHSFCQHRSQDLREENMSGEPKVPRMSASCSNREAVNLRVWPQTLSQTVKVVSPHFIDTKQSKTTLFTHNSPRVLQSKGWKERELKKFKLEALKSWSCVSFSFLGGIYTQIESCSARETCHKKMGSLYPEGPGRATREARHTFKLTREKFTRGHSLTRGWPLNS